MNSREAVFSALVIGGLLFTGSTFLEQSSFDCYQPMFSNQSTCSLKGGSCIKIQVKTGAVGLWDQFKNLIVESTQERIRIQCAPDCYIDLNAKILTKSDSATHQLP